MKYLNICSALYDYTAQNEEEISFKAQDVLYILEKEDPDWHKAQLKVANTDGPIGLIPANYIEKIKPIASIKAIYDYQSRSAEELSFKEDELLTLYEKDDPDWFVVENSKGVLGIVPSNYVEETVSETVVEKTIEKQTTGAEPKWAIALYGFEAESKEETYLHEHEQVLVIDYENKDWWKIEHKDGTSGIVPANYIKFQDEYEQELKVEQQEQREKDLLERKLVREQEEKEKERQLEVERRRKMQEDAKQKEVEAKRQATFAANNAASSPQLGSPRRSQIPAPPPPTIAKSVPEHNDPNKPDPSRVRMWTDRTGAFKVEAQFLSCANGKIRLFKTNGVKIDVPTQKMCTEDLKYVEAETGQKLIEDKSDNIPLGRLNVRFSWLEYFKKANLPRDAAHRYAASFDSSGLTERDLDRLTHHRMKSLGMSERHVRRIQRFIETNRAEPGSEDEGDRPKVKKSVTFGAVSYMEEYDDDEHEEGSVEWQIEQDERLARQLQEQDQGPSVSLQRRGTGRPTPAQSAPRGVSSAVLTPQQFNPEPLKPTPVLSPAATSPVKNNVPVPPPKFEDDAWAPRSSPSVTPPAWNQPAAAAAIPPQMPPRQRPTPQTSQQSLVDPQLLAKWGGSPALAAANTRPVPPPPPAVPYVASPNHQTLNSLSAQKPMFYQQQQQVAGSGSFNMGQVQQQQGSFTNAQSPMQQPMQQQQAPVMNQTQVPGSFTAAHQSPMQHQVPAHANSFTSTGFGGQQNQFGAPQQSASFSSLPNTNFQAPTFNQANQFQAQTTGYSAPYSNQAFMGSTSSLQPQLTGASSIQSQSTGASWASATPANPFGGIAAATTPSYQAQYNNNTATGIFFFFFFLHEFFLKQIFF
ncbi:hypothetical protein HPULCUR_002266 [Helicostylum pulchrum]|uniref:Actin cytoskeleton-regulatory complex protein SLA1 n=1 Tax=Helicostylum pulchrum TaxID=562976 RepID=A0ABP9XQ66_9FUNG